MPARRLSRTTTFPGSILCNRQKSCARPRDQHIISHLCPNLVAYRLHGRQPEKLVFVFLVARMITQLLLCQRVEDPCPGANAATEALKFIFLVRAVDPVILERKTRQDHVYAQLLFQFRRHRD